MQQKSEKINEEKIKCQHMADLAQADLAEAMPALEEAVKVSNNNHNNNKHICIAP